MWVVQLLVVRLAQGLALKSETTDTPGLFSAFGGTTFDVTADRQFSASPARLFQKLNFSLVPELQQVDHDQPFSSDRNFDEEIITQAGPELDGPSVVSCSSEPDSHADTREIHENLAGQYLAVQQRNFLEQKQLQLRRAHFEQKKHVPRWICPYNCIWVK